MLELLYFSSVIPVGGENTIGRKQLQSTFKKIFQISEVV